MVNLFEGEGIRVSRAKAAVNNSKVAESLANIQRDYTMLPKLIQKVESSKYTLVEAHADILAWVLAPQSLLNLDQLTLDCGWNRTKRRFITENMRISNI